MVNVGTVYIPRYQICLYRTRLEVYHCTSQNCEPDNNNQQDKKLFRVFNFDKSANVKEMTKDIRDTFHIPFVHTTRLWIKRPAGVESAQVKADEPKDRQMTVDVTDRDGDWVFLRNLAEKTTALELAEDSDRVELIIESTVKPRPETNDWPRGHLLEKVRYIPVSNECLHISCSNWLVFLHSGRTVSKRAI